jgi:hypothetical protein
MATPFIKDVLPYREREYPPLSPTSPYIPYIPYIGPSIPQTWANRLFYTLDKNQNMATNRQPPHPYPKLNRPPIGGTGAMTNVQKEMENRMAVEGINNLVPRCEHPKNVLVKRCRKLHTDAKNAPQEKSRPKTKIKKMGKSPPRREAH